MEDTPFAGDFPMYDYDYSNHSSDFATHPLHPPAYQLRLTQQYAQTQIFSHSRFNLQNQTTKLASSTFSLSFLQKGLRYMEKEEER